MTKQEIIDYIYEQHKQDLDSLIMFLDKELEGKPYKYPKHEDY